MWFTHSRRLLCNSLQIPIWFSFRKLGYNTLQFINSSIHMYSRLQSSKQSLSLDSSHSSDQNLSVSEDWYVHRLKDSHLFANEWPPSMIKVLVKSSNESSILGQIDTTYEMNGKKRFLRAG